MLFLQNGAHSPLQSKEQNTVKTNFHKHTYRHTHTHAHTHMHTNVHTHTNIHTHTHPSPNLPNQNTLPLLSATFPLAEEKEKNLSRTMSVV